MANRRIETTELDFDGIKTSLKSFLKGQSQFSDYDFEGSAMSVLLDILAYNTHYNALYYNMAINEAFIDSASKRSSVVSKAKELGYVPKSATAASAKIVVLMINDQITAPASITLDAYTPFTTMVDNVSYTFYNPSVQSALKVGNQYVFPDVILKEGIPLQYSYTYDGSTPIIVPNTGVDLSTLRVTVQENAQSTSSTVYTEVNSIVDLTPTSTVYFVRELDDGTYQLEFGNDVIGKALDIGNVITIDYFVCNKSAPNGASSFTFSGTPPANTLVFVTTTLPAAGGADAEDVESIRYNAPRAYTAQNRCVTAEDFKSTIMSLYTPAKSVSVWGGEDNVPPIYGKVFISIVPDTLDVLSETEKTYVIDEILAPRKALSITPVIVDPMYVRLEINTTFYYNPTQTTRTSTELENLVRQTILDYNDVTLGQFGSVFKYSKLIGAIDATEQSITSNITTVKIHFEVTPVYNVTNQYVLDLGNPIYNSGVPEESIISTGFTVADTTETCYIDDIPGGDASGLGTLRMFYISSSGDKILVRNVGTVDYTTGIVNVTDLTITGIETTPFKFIIKPQSNDVAGIRDQYVLIDDALLSIGSVAESSTKNYTFTSSRT